MKLTISKEILSYVADGDTHIKLDNVEYSTDLREIITIGYMLEHPHE
jgi:hypothetical protein